MTELHAKAVMLLEAMTEKHDETARGEHWWRRCRRCRAFDEGRRPRGQILLRYALDVVKCKGEA